MVATVYISPTGDDTTGDGSEGNPWETLSKACASTVANDIIFALPGIHTWVTQNTSTRRDLTGESPLTTIFDAGGAQVVFQVGNDGQASNITFRDGQAGAIVPSIPIFISGDSLEKRFTNCIFHNLTTPDDSQSIFGDLGSNPLGILTMTACLFRDCGRTGGSRGIFGMITANAFTLNLLNNTFYSDRVDTETCPIISNVNSATITAVLKNNIIVNVNGTPKVFSSGAAPSYGASTNNLISGYSSVPSLTNTLTSDPLFVDAANANFSLRPGSPAEDAGVII